MRYRVLGEVDVVVDDHVHAIGSRNQRLVLAALLAHPNAVVSTGALIEALWDDDPPASALPTLRSYVSRLRRLVGASLDADATGYRIAVEPSGIDALVFEQRLDAAAAGTPAAAVDVLDDALAMWRGPAFGDHADVPLILGAARRLEELRTDALEARVTALLSSGAANRAAADATALLVDHPHREGLWIALIDALVTTNRSVDASRAATRARRALADAGMEPGEGLRRAEARALGIDSATADRVPAVETPGRPVVTGTGGRPAPGLARASTFIGREAQLTELAELLVTAPIVTLVGPGGVGKTRLAAELAAHVAPRHRLGARMIELGALTDPDDVAGAIASGLGLTIDRASVDDVLTSAGDLDLVAVIDNAEHVAAAAAQAVEVLASGGGSIRIIVTSRQRLAVDGEHVRAVRPLAADDAAAPAQALLRDRAAAVGAELGDVDDDPITRVVQRLDGLPLAIEMAAAQLTSCSVAELLAILDQRLDELASESTRVPPRHQSLGALIDWSVDRLEPADSTLLHHLTVFAGQFVADDVAGCLGADAVASTRRLADLSLLAVVTASDRTTFRVLHVVRERIHHRVGPVPPEVRAAHAQWYLRQARSAVADLTSPRERSGRDALHRILDELRAAHRWATDHDRPVALALSAAIHPFAQTSLNDEVLSWADRLVADAPRPDDDRDHLAVAMASAAVRVVNRGEHIRGAELARRALAMAEHVEARLPALEVLADATLADGQLDESDAAYQMLMDDGHVAGSAWYEASGATGVLLVACYAGRTPSRAIDPSEFDRDAPSSARAWLAFGEAELVAADDPRRAEALCERALALARSASNRYIEGVTLVSLASTQCRNGRPDAALATFRTAVEHWLDAADHTHQVTTLRNLAVLFRTLDLPVETATLLGGVAVADVTTYGIELANVDTIDRWLTDTLPPDELAAARAAGAELTVTDLARWVLTVIDRVSA